MKHVFVINPCAGARDIGDDIAAEADKTGLEAEFYETTAPRDATRFAGQWCAAHPAEDVRFYACGGDGTLNEVVDGVMRHGDGRRIEVACYPCGSGNDFVRYFEGCDFADIEALSKGSAVAVDAMRVTVGNEVHYCVNTFNFGFEAEVCRAMAAVRRWPLVGGRLSYTSGILKALFTARRNPCRIEVDGEPWRNEPLLLAGVANGMYDGGGYRCAPHAVVDDGLLEVMAIRPMSVMRFATMIGSYKNGTHLDDHRLHDVLGYRRASHVAFENDRPFCIAIDGEVLHGTSFEIECLNRVLNFVLPRNNQHPC